MRQNRQNAQQARALAARRSAARRLVGGRPQAAPARGGLTWRRLPALLLLGWLGVRAPAQSQPAGHVAEVEIAASERTLWISRSTGTDTLIVQRDGGGEFDLGRSLARPIERLLALDDDTVLAVMRDGELYRFRRGVAEPTRERQLPPGGRALDLAARGNTLYGVFPARVFETLAPVESAAPAASAPSSLAPGVALFDGQQWRALLRCPEGVPGAGVARVGLLVRKEQLLLAWSGEDDAVHAAVAPLPQAAAWRLLAVPDASASSLFLVESNQTPMLVAIGGREPLAAWRLLGHGAQEAWRATTLQLSPLAAEGANIRYARVVGFNQHLALLGSDGRNAFVRFARAGESPALATLPVAAVFGERAAVVRTRQYVQVATYAVLLGLMIVLLVFRRDSMLNAAQLPPGTALAFTFQRFFAWAIDFAPLTFVSSLIVGVPWLEGWSVLSNWGLSPDNEDVLPPPRVLGWWALSIGGAAAYSALAEMTTGRTLGKRLLGLRVVSERGVPAGLWQLLIRNLMRVLELLPHFWVFALLTVVSRNRQRLGDIVARTIVVRALEQSPQRRREPAAPDSEADEAEPRA